MKNSIYDESFYATQSSGSYKSAQRIIPIVSQLFPQITQVIDVGCGVGTWLRAWQESNPKLHILGIDGNSVEEDAFFISKQHYQMLDLTHPYQENLQIISQKANGGGGITLVQSLEVAEHFNQKYAQNFISLLTSLGDIILFSAAIPFQGGTHHVNEQPPKYWADLFAHQDFVCFDILREKIWNDDEIESWYRQNILLFVKKDKMELLKEYTSTKYPMYLISPEAWEAKSIFCEKIDTHPFFSILFTLRRKIKNILGNKADNS